MSTYFVSDLHLCPTRPVLTGLFYGFLQSIPASAEAVYILGDLFEYWAGDDDLSDHYNADICHALRQCKAPLFIMRGNRDFLFGEAFAKATNATLLPDEYVVNLHGKPTLLLHGDTLCTDDTEYQSFRRMVRTSTWQNEFLAKPLSERKAMIEGMRQQSESQKQQKAMSIMDVNTDSVASAFLNAGVQHMIHGHTHRLNTHLHRVDGKDCSRYVLGDWHDTPNGGNYLQCNAEGWTRHTVG